MTDIKKIESIFTSDFNMPAYVELMQEIFSSMRIINPNNQIPEFSNFSSHIKNYTHVGEYKTPENKKIAILAVELKKGAFVESSRSTQRAYVKKLIENGNCEAAVVAFHTEGEPKWRLSFVRLDYEMKFEGGKFKNTENITPAKRYSFLVGKGEPCHTAIDRFSNFLYDSNSEPELDKIEEAFSVEKVTKEFFNLYCEKFYQLEDYLSHNDVFMGEAERCGFTSEQFAKKLMGQIVFLYFLQKKGWLGVKVWVPQISESEYKKAFFGAGVLGREYLPKIYKPQSDGTYRFVGGSVLDTIPDDAEEAIANNMPTKYKWGDGSQAFLRAIFEYSKKHKGGYFQNYLEPIFYNTLNNNRGLQAYCTITHSRIPFLSGGLFEPIKGYDWAHIDFHIPDEIFSNKKDENDRNADGILDVFDRYNFTIAEDEPLEREVAIDPEMLGKVFENLLEIKDRKSKGAFYTPREIVHYMCQESLINYIVTKTGISEVSIRDLILYGEFIKSEDTVKEKREENGGAMYIGEDIFEIDNAGKIITNRLDEVDKALENVKVADPAVGSGAFPMGMVNEIVKARQTLTDYMTIAIKINAISEAQGSFLAAKLHSDRSAYNLKKHAIKDSIFAVDLEPSAVDICQLRLWLSLVIDDNLESGDDTHSDGNPCPLPNLECNILCGNSLVDEYKGIKLTPAGSILGIDNDVSLTLEQYAVRDTVDKYIKAQDELFYCADTRRKEELINLITLCKAEIIRTQLAGANADFFEEFNKAYNMQSKPFVLWQLDFVRVFRDNGGFDIVVGNPPYISTKGVSSQEKRMLERIYGFADDTYNMFTFKGMSLLRSGGSINYIIPKTFWTTQSKRNMRDLLLARQIKYIFDTANPFESAMVDTCIISVVNTPYEANCRIRFIDGSKSLYSPEKLEVYQSVYLNTQNNVIFKPSEYNMKIHNLYGTKVKILYDKWWDKIKTSKDIEKNKILLDKYRSSLKPGDVALLGCLTEGGQGLATANNGKYIAVRKSTKWANNIISSRPVKLASAIKENNIPIEKLYPYTSVDDFFARADEKEIARIFDLLKDLYGRDIFGQGYIYRLIDDSELADVDQMSKNEKENGIDIDKNYYVPYDKGDKDGNRWYLETPFAIAWSKENVHFLKTNSGKKGAGMPVVRNPQFNFREGFCWSDINTTYLKCRIKGKSVNDVKSMSLYGLTDSIPEYYLVSLINSSFISHYVDDFINNTQTFQINDARQLPIIVPDSTQLEKIEQIFKKAVSVKISFFQKQLSESEASSQLEMLQASVDSLVENIYSIH